MRIYVAVTDTNWYQQLSSLRADEVNFWNPGGHPLLKDLRENEMVLFKLKAPYSKIAGGGFFVRFIQLPVFLAWQTFGGKNGTRTMEDLLASLQSRKSNIHSGTAIGCTILTDPFWLEESDWFAAPEFAGNIMRGKVYDTDTPVGRMLFAEIQERMPRAIRSPDMVAEDEDVPRYGLALAKHRLGQGGFRVVVTDTYQGRCAITGEKTLPVLEAAHIQPYAANGPHLITNGILVKSDFHTLFDSGYLTVSPDYHIEVSHRLHEDFGNGKIYYQYHGQMLHLPEDPAMRPAPQFLNYHNEKIYLG